jgi:hypothetical protein
MQLLTHVTVRTASYLLQNPAQMKLLTMKSVWPKWERDLSWSKATE